MPVAIDLKDEVFGDLTVLKRVLNRGARAHWKCKCSCGETTIVSGKNLRIGKTKSCGCRRGVYFKKVNFKHGHSIGKRSPTYHTWGSMWARCSNPKHIHFKYYGGRGIMVCEEWMAFETFLADMGDRPSGMTLERKDNNGNYEPDNCIWADWETQIKNRRKSFSHDLGDQ